MPLFSVAGGQDIWIPRERIVEASAQPGLLTTKLSVIVPQNGNFPGGIGVVEVNGSVATIAALLDGFQPRAGTHLVECS